MGSCRILHNTRLSQLLGWGPVCFISTAYNFLFGLKWYYYHLSLQVVIFCCLEVARSSYCVLSLGWPKESSAQLRSCTKDKDGLLATVTFNFVYFKPSKSDCPPRLPLRCLLEFQGDVVFFFNHFAQRKIQETKYQCSTYKDPISTVPKQHSVFFFQEIGTVFSVSTSRTE